MSKAQLQSLLSQIENNKVALGNSYQYLSTLLKNAISQKNKKQNYKKFFGKTSAWQKYLDAGGIFVDVDISHLKLKNPPFVNTYLTSQGGSIWQLTGPSAIYDLTNKGFRVFLSKPEDLKYASVQNAKTFGWILNYQVISLD